MNPYVINSLPVASGQIGLCCCPGHRLTPSFVRPSLHDFEADLDAIAAFGATQLVTLMQPEELAYIGIDPKRLDREAQARGLAWLHLPIRNLGVPGEAWETTWLTAGRQLRDTLVGGGRIAMHCYAGLGRTGTVAARLLIEHGMRPAEAITLVRRIRPGSIETFEQESYIQAVRWPGVAVKPASSGPGS